MVKSLLIFDLDGTLIDSSSDIARAANGTLRAYGYAERPVEAIKEDIGWGVKQLLERLMPSEPPERITAAREIFLDLYAKALVVDTYPYPGVLDGVARFHGAGKKMAVATNKPERLAREILDALGMSRYFLMILGGDSLSNRKPHPEPVVKILDELKKPASEAVLIGDSPIDCETGRLAGVATIGVTYGFRSRGELEAASCDVIVDSFPELEKVIV